MSWSNFRKSLPPPVKWTLDRLIAQSFEPPHDPGRPEQELTYGDLNAFVERTRNFGGDSLKMIYSFMKVIALTTATLVFMRMLLEVDLTWHSERTIDPYLVLKFVAFAVSFIVLLIT